MKSSLAIAAGLALASAGNVPYTNCGSSSDILQNVAVTASPYPPKPGNSVAIDVTGTLTQAVKTGNYELAVSVDGITVIHKSGSVCDLTSCPIAQGPFKASKSENIPGSVPAGTYDAKLSATANGGDALFCADLKLSIGADGEESLVATAKTAPFKALQHMISAAREGEERGFEAGFEIEAGAAVELHLDAGVDVGVDALDEDATADAKKDKKGKVVKKKNKHKKVVKKKGETNKSFDGAESVKNILVGLAAGGDLDVKAEVGVKFAAGVKAGEAAFRERGREHGHGHHGHHGAPAPAPPAVESDLVLGQVPMGGDRDEHGCISSAGYTWCEAKAKCLRVFEEDCPQNDLVVNCALLQDHDCFTSNDCELADGKCVQKRIF